VPAGFLTTNKQETKRDIDWGYTFVAIGVDVGIFARAVDAPAKKFKG